MPLILAGGRPWRQAECLAAVNELGQERCFLARKDKHERHDYDRECNDRSIFSPNVEHGVRCYSNCYSKTSYRNPTKEQPCAVPGSCESSGVLCRLRDSLFRRFIGVRLHLLVCRWHPTSEASGSRTQPFAIVTANTTAIQKVAMNQSEIVHRQRRFSMKRHALLPAQTARMADKK